MTEISPSGAGSTAAAAGGAHAGGEHAHAASTSIHVVVIGSGIAGLTAAIHATENGCQVTVVTKDVLDNANTRFAQGGIAGVMFADDRAEDHFQDTLTAGAGLSEPEAVRVLVDEGPARIHDLIALGVAFDRAADGTLVKGLEAAHSYPRILHAGGDATGTAIEHALVAGLHESGATIIEHAFLIDLVCTSGTVTGVELLVGESEHAAGTRTRIDADAVILASGGAGELYAHSTNPALATGDGIAAALRAGAAVSDMEFVQFHPTVLATDVPFLVSEAVRGEGATLIDESGHRFVGEVHPDGELAPRDVVARAIAARILAQDGRPVFLDATGIGGADPSERAAFLARRFPTIDRAVRERGLDWAAHPIPVTPAAHYLMGGISTDLHGRTSIPGLYAVGEVARTGVHGANRLASNSLLEGAVFGARVGDTVAADAAQVLDAAEIADRHATFGEQDDRPHDNRPLRPDSSNDQIAHEAFSRAALQSLMWDYVGLSRNDSGLSHAASVISRWQASVRQPRTEHEYEDENLLLIAAEMVRAARERTDSVGSHFRSDDSPSLQEAHAC